MTDQRETPGNLDGGLAEEFGVHPLRPARRRRLLPMVVAIGLLAIGGALAFHLYSMYRDSLPSVASPQVPASQTADTGVKLEDFREFQQRANSAQQSTEELLKAQQLEIARLSEQINVLTGKVDLLQRPAASVEDPPPSAPVRTPPARKKNTSSPKPPASDISVGGAPLPGR